MFFNIKVHDFLHILKELKTFSWIPESTMPTMLDG